jgi:hypothetical protein
MPLHLQLPMTIVESPRSKLLKTISLWTRPMPKRRKSIAKSMRSMTGRSSCSLRSTSSGRSSRSVRQAEPATTSGGVDRAPEALLVYDPAPRAVPRSAPHGPRSRAGSVAEFNGGQSPGLPGAVTSPSRRASRSLSLRPAKSGRRSSAVMPVQFDCDRDRDGGSDADMGGGSMDAAHAGVRHSSAPRVLTGDSGQRLSVANNMVQIGRSVSCEAVGGADRGSGAEAAGGRDGNGQPTGHENEVQKQDEQRHVAGDKGGVSIPDMDDGSASSVGDDDDDEEKKVIKAANDALAAEAREEEARRDAMVKAEFGTSLMIFSHKNKFRKALMKCVTEPIFDHFILAVIGMSSVCVAMDTPLSDPHASTSRIIPTLDLIFTILFTVEMMMKIVTFGLVSGECTCAL